MFLELTFSDSRSLYEYLQYYSCSAINGRTLWYSLFTSRDNEGYPFIWYSPLTKEYHIDVHVDGRTEVYGRLPRFKWDKLNEDAMIVWWDPKNNIQYSQNYMKIRMFDDNWCWSNEALREVIFDGDIYKVLPPIYECDDSINITTIKVYTANKHREYVPMFKPSTSNSTLFELSFQSISDLEKYLCIHEKDLRKTIVMHVDPVHTYRNRYPLVIHRKPLYDGQPDTYLVDIYAEDEKDLDIGGWNIEVHKVETKGHYGHYVGEPSPRWYVKTDTYGFFPMQEGRYKWRTYKLDWTPDRDKTYMITARCNGKGIGQALEALKQKIINQYALEKTLKYLDTDVTATVEYHNSNLQTKELKELKERINMMFGVDLNRIPEIKDVKFNNPATIVFWADGTKTVVKRQKGDRFDKEKGLAMAIVKKLFGNKGKYNDLFKKWIKEDK